MSYPFPDDIRDPDRQSPNPFADDAGDALAADHQAAADPNEFKTPNATGDYQPEYEATYSNRAILVMCLGTIGLGLSALGWLAYADHLEVGLMPLFSLAFAIPAASLGWNNLRAINSGAMQGNRKGLLIAGLLLGVVGIFNSIAYGLVTIFVFDLFR